MWLWVAVTVLPFLWLVSSLGTTWVLHRWWLRQLEVSCHQVLTEEIRLQDERIQRRLSRQTQEPSDSTPTGLDVSDPSHPSPSPHLAAGADVSHLLPHLPSPRSGASRGR